MSDAAVRIVGVVGPTATGKSHLALALAERFDGEIVACDSTAVYRGLDIGTDKVPVTDQRGIPHHLVDLVPPTEVYSAARWAQDAARTIRAIADRGRLPVVAGGTGFYFRALTRGLFPGPGRDDALRARLDRVAGRRGVEALHRWLARVDPPSALRIQPRDQKRLVRALEVYLLTARPLSAHFAETAAPLPGLEVCAVGLTLPREALRDRVARRVDAQLARGVVDEVRELMDAGVPASAHAFSGLVYRQVLEHLRGDRDLAATRELIIRENMRYARRQALWFRKEPGIRWFEGAGESPAIVGAALAHVEAAISRRVPESG
ncbi:MAG: tRNA (adenosine(37)-N6)-dimethylallyltransferase MiaA [Vicinamibacterales bacterium]